MGGEEVFRLKKKNNEWRYNVVRIHTEKGMVENRRNIGVEIIDIDESVGDYETAMGQPFKSKASYESH